MKTNCLYCENENPKHGMKTCSRKCADELKKINSREKRSCLFCKCDFEVRQKDTKQICSEACRKKWSELPENIEARIKASKEAVKDKFGVDNVFQLESVKDKSKETKLEKYGDENYCNREQQNKTLYEKYGVNYFNELNSKLANKFTEKYGVSHPLKLKEFRDKLKETAIEKYGVENVSQNENVKNKKNETIKERFGVDNISQNLEIKKKKKATSLKNFGVEHHLKDYGMFQKHLKAQYKIDEYKDTGINYQGSYEKYFLELLEENGLLSEVSVGQSFEYDWNGEKHAYHTDFTFRGKQIEIKSGWTYNKNGKDQELQKLNETKWSAAKNSGVNLVILIDKKEIVGFIKAQ
jgi:hypothetical protein